MPAKTMAANAEAPSEAPSERASDTEAAAAPSRAMPAASLGHDLHHRHHAAEAEAGAEAERHDEPLVGRAEAEREQAGGGEQQPDHRDAPSAGRSRRSCRPVSAAPQTMPAVSGSSCSPASAEFEPSVSCR